MRKIFKKIIAPVAVIGSVVALASCNKNNNMNYETENTKIFKEVINLVEENRENKKGYGVSFVQDFNYEENKELDFEISNYKAHYHTNGSFLLSYEGKNIEIEKGLDGFITNATGFLSGYQTEKHEIENKETDKETKEVIRQDNYNRGVENRFIYDTNDTNVSLMSETKYIDYSNRDNDITDKFAGTIAKQTLLDTVEADKLKKALNDLMFVDVWDSVNSLVELMHNTFVNLNNKGYEDIYKYLENKNFSFEKRDNLIVVKYTIDVDDSLKETTENKYNDVELNFQIDTQTKEIKYFRFDLSKYLASVFASENDTKVASSKVNEYYIEGNFINEQLTRFETTNTTYNKYTEDNKYEFIDDFMVHALPTREDIFDSEE